MIDLLLSAKSLAWITLFSVVCIIYRYMKDKYRYFEKQNVPYDQNIYPIFGNLWKSWCKVPSEEDKRKHKLFGTTWGEFEGVTPIWVTVDMEMIKTIFVKDSDSFASLKEIVVSDEILNNIMFSLKGEKWKTTRKLVSPGFSPKHIKAMWVDMNECVENLMKNVEKNQKNGVLETRSAFGGYSIDVIASCGFGIKIDSVSNPDSEFVKHSKVFTDSFIGNPLSLLPFILDKRIIKRLPGILGEEGGKFYTKIVKRAIEIRKSSEKRNDFLSALIDASIEGGKVDGLDDTTLIAQCVTFFLAGYEPITMALTYAVYLLAKNPEVQNRLYQEIEEAAKSEDEFVYTKMRDCKYLESVVYETLRIHPILPRIERTATKNYQYKDYTIHKGDVVRIPVPLMHMNDVYYPEPEVFRPERFLSRNEDFETFSWLTFGLGARRCMGERFALEEIKLALFRLVEAYKFYPTPNTPTAISYQKNGFMQSVDKLEIGCLKRNVT